MMRRSHFAMSFRIWRQLLSSDPFRFHRRRYDVDVYRYGHLPHWRPSKPVAVWDICVSCCVTVGTLSIKQTILCFVGQIHLLVLVLQCSGVLKENALRSGKLWLLMWILPIGVGHSLTPLCFYWTLWIALAVNSMSSFRIHFLSYHSINPQCISTGYAEHHVTKTFRTCRSSQTHLWHLLGDFQERHEAHMQRLAVPDLSG